MSQLAQAHADDDNTLEAAPDYDSWYSGMISFMFHFTLFVLVGLLSSVARVKPTLAPAVSVVQVADAVSSGGDSLDEAMGDGVEGTEASQPAEEFADAASPTDMLEEVDVQVEATAPTAAATTADIRERLAKTQATAASAKAAAAKRLNENLGGSAGGKKGGGGQGKGRAGRAARWVLRFNNSSPRQYLAQLGGLGAEIAFPQRGDNYQFFSNLDSTPTSSVRGLGSEKRIYWMDEDRSSYQSIARELRVSDAPFMIAFLPVKLEDKMLALEKSYQGVDDEDAVEQTIFECVQRGDGYDVVVINQTLRN